MANYYATARSNYFAVRDRDAFLQAIAPLELTIKDRADGTLTLLVDSAIHPHGWPQGHIDPATHDWVPSNLWNLIAEHLAEDHVAILMETGAEGLRYLRGEAVAINSDGYAARITLEDIYDIARELGSHVSKAES